MSPFNREPIVAPSDWDLALAPEIALLFVLDAAIIAAHRVLSISLDPSSSTEGGAKHPPTRDLLDAMRALRVHIHQHRFVEAASDEDCQDEWLDPF